MRQAIDEGFILDVLRNYLTYRTYWRLRNAAVEEASRQVDPRKAKARLVRAAELHPTSQEQRAQIIVDHFREHAMGRLGGRAKAMVVTRSREHAVKLYQAIRAYADRREFTDCAALVAFSGTLSLEGIDYTEPKLNGFAERELPARFGYVKADDPHAATRGQREYRILVVAEKYQTGFDQPLLTTMYVDKPLVGLAAVQTLSRLNRTAPLKSQEDVCVLDFANNAEDIQAASSPISRRRSPSRPTRTCCTSRSATSRATSCWWTRRSWRSPRSTRRPRRRRRRAASWSGRTRSCTGSPTRPATGTRR